MAVTIADYQETSWAITTTPRSTPAITWQDGDLILAFAANENGALPGVPTATGLTFTSFISDGTPGGTCGTRVSKATAVGSGSSAVACTNSAGVWGMGVFVLRNHNGTGATVANDGTAHTQNIAGTLAGSLVIWLAGDFSAGAVQGLSPTPDNIRENSFTTGAYTVYLADVNNVAGGTLAVGLTAGGTSGNIAILGVEVKAATNPPATAAGQYGWGTYGAGDYGPNFGGASSTPITVSETFSFNEGAAVIAVSAALVDTWTVSDSPASVSQQNALSANDSAAQSEGTTSLADSLAASDSWGFTDNAGAVAATLASLVDSWALSELSSLAVATAANDSWALTDASAVGQLLAVSANDSWALADSSLVATQLALSALDSFTMSEQALYSAATAVVDALTQAEGATAINATVAASDVWSLSEVSALADTISASDAWALLDSSAVSILEQRAANDSWTLGEAGADMATGFPVTDSATQTEGTTALEQRYAVVDSWAVTDASSLAVSLAAADAWALIDLSALTDLKTASEALSAGENSALANTLAANDSATLSEGLTSIALTLTDAWALGESSVIGGQMAAVDAWALSEIVNAVGEQATFSASDSATQSEGVTTIAQQNLVAVADAFTLVEASALAVTLAAVEGLSLADASALAATIGVSDASALTELAVIGDITQLSASDVSAFADTRVLSAYLDKFDALTVDEALSQIAAALAASETSTTGEVALPASDQSTFINVSDAFIVIEQVDRDILRSGFPSVKVTVYTQGLSIPRRDPRHPFTSIPLDERPAPGR